MFMGDVPFRDVYIHGLVLDEKGQKMSKTKGNSIDPLVLIDKYGADALRIALASQTAQGRNIRRREKRVEGYRNFATKLWNAARFAEMNECVRQRDFEPERVKETLNRWIVGETERSAAASHNGDPRVPLQRRRQRRLRVHLGHLLRLVSGTRQADLRRRRRSREDRDARRDRLGARPDPEAAAPVHALHHGGAVGPPGRSRRRAPVAAVPVAVAGTERPRAAGGR